MIDKEQIEDLKGQLVQALVRNSASEARISVLESILLRLPTIETSKNSHNPPSVDEFGKYRSLREKSNKRMGG